MKLIKRSSAKAGQFVECLSHVAVEGKESSFQVWTRLVNKGGLFDLNDATLSIEIKLKMCFHVT